MENAANDIKEHVKDTNVWVRLVFMVIFAALYWVAEIVLAIVVVFQFLCVLFTGKKNEKVLTLGAQLSAYAYQIFRYLTYNSEVQPFPMGDWPSGAELKESGTPAAAKAEEAFAGAKKTPRKQAPAARSSASPAKKTAAKGKGSAARQGEGEEAEAEKPEV